MKIELTPQELVDVGVSEFSAENICNALAEINPLDDPLDCWQEIVREVLTPYIVFSVHQLLYNKVSEHWETEKQGPMPAWVPSVARQQGSNINTIMQRANISDFESLYQWSINERDSFWATMVETLGIQFDTPYQDICDLSEGSHAPKWLSGAKLNIAESCFGADSEQPAIIFQRDGESPLEEMTYGQLQSQVNRVANGLKEAGFKPGDALAIDMIMNLESVIIYLGIVKAGCAVISIADSFTPPEIATRLRIGKAAGIFTMDHVMRGAKQLPMYAKVCEAEAPRAIVIPCGDSLSVDLREGDLSWGDFLSENMSFEAVVSDPEAIMNILFSSGTTGDPKAIPWNHTTPIKGAVDGYLHHDIHQGDVVCWPTNLGWMMGPWLLFATLINKGTIALFYQAPTGADFCKFVEKAEVSMLGLVPSLVKAWRHSNALDECDWSRIQCFSSTGECSAPGDMLYLMSRANYQPVIEYCGGTEIGGGYAASTVVQPSIPSTFSTPALGTELVILDEDLRPDDSGEVYLVPPSMGLSITLLNKDHYEQYYEGTPKTEDGRTMRRHGDQLQRLPNGYIRAHGRADDTMNLGGIKVGSAEIERVLKSVSELDETAAVAISPPDGGPSQLVIFATLKQGEPGEHLRSAMQQEIRSNLNPLFKIHEVVVVDSLPRTASGKVMRRLLRKQYQERT